MVPCCVFLCFPEFGCDSVNNADIRASSCAVLDGQVNEITLVHTSEMMRLISFQYGVQWDGGSRHVVPQV